MCLRAVTLIHLRFLFFFFVFFFFFHSFIHWMGLLCRSTEMKWLGCCDKKRRIISIRRFSPSLPNKWVLQLKCHKTDICTKSYVGDWNFVESGKKTRIRARIYDDFIIERNAINSVVKSMHSAQTRIFHIFSISSRRNGDYFVVIQCGNVGNLIIHLRWIVWQKNNYLIIIGCHLDLILTTFSTWFAIEMKLEIKESHFDCDDENRYKIMQYHETSDFTIKLSEIQLLRFNLLLIS